MCQLQRPGFSFGDLEKCGAVKIEEFADAALGVFDFAVYLVSGEIDKKCRNLGQQPFEPQRLFEIIRNLKKRLRKSTNSWPSEAVPGRWAVWCTIRRSSGGIVSVR